jgi:hypothetical protein
VQKARKRHAPLPPNLEFMTLDACEGPPPDRSYGILIDRGCLHTIPEELRPEFVRNITAFAAPGARMLLFMKAFREDRPVGDRVETEAYVTTLAALFAGKFVIERAAPTYLDRFGGKKPAAALPGLVLWMSSATT